MSADTLTTIGAAERIISAVETPQPVVSSEDYRQNMNVISPADVPAEEVKVEDLHVSDGTDMENNYNNKKSKGDSSMSKTVVLGGGMGMGACGYNPAMMGGYGYGLGGIPPFGMIGMWPGGFGGGWGRDGHRGGGDWGGHGMIPMEAATQREIGNLNTNMNSRFNDVNGDVRTSRIEAAIGGVQDHLGHQDDRKFTMALSEKDSFYALKGAIDACCCNTQKEIGFTAAATQKEIANQACATRETISNQEEKTRHLIAEIERSRQSERLCAAQAEIVELKGANSNLRQTGELMSAIGALAARIDRMEHHGRG